jgi:hypothetical protein
MSAEDIQLNHSRSTTEEQDRTLHQGLVLPSEIQFLRMDFVQRFMKDDDLF